MKKTLTIAAIVAALCLVGEPAYATETSDPIPETAIEIPDQPAWGYEWRDREYTVVCDGENSTRIVIQSMWRPTEPEWDGEQWVTYDDWHEWAWPEAMQTVYKPLEPGDCPTAAAPAGGGSGEPAPSPEPEAVTTNTPGPRTELAVTGVPKLPWQAVATGAAAIVAGLAIMRRAVVRK